MRVVIGGIPGVGKTTVLGHLIEVGLNVENFGDVMLGEAITRGFVKDRDQMRKMPLERQLEIQRVAAEYFSRKESVVIDTHLTVKTGSGYLPGLPLNVLNTIKPGLIVSLEADPHEVFLRRAKDNTRARDMDSEEDIRRHMEMNRMYGAAYSALSGCAFLTVNNETGKSDEAARKILKAIEGK
ncbi:MAG: adenylate kinase [Thermoplasmata archaeon]